MVAMPEFCGVRESAAAFLASTPRDSSPIFSFAGVKAAAQGFADEFCKQLLLRRIDSVTLVGASDDFKRHFMRAHMLRSAKFTVELR